MADESVLKKEGNETSSLACDPAVMSLSSIHKSTTKGKITDFINFLCHQYFALISDLSNLVAKVTLSL
jgi:hypothetical protein